MNFIEVNGVGLRYELSGRGDRTVVLIHEMGGSLESWDAGGAGAGRRPACAALRHPWCRPVREGARHAFHRHHGRRPRLAHGCARHHAKSRACRHRRRRGDRAACGGAHTPAHLRRHRRQSRHRHRARPPHGGAGSGRAHRARGHARGRRRLDGQRLSARVADRCGALCRLPRPLARQRSRQATPPSTACSPASTCRASLPASPARSW